MGDIVRYFGGITYVTDMNPKIGTIVGIRLSRDGYDLSYVIVGEEELEEVVNYENVMPIVINADILESLHFERIGKTNHYRFFETYNRECRDFAQMDYYLDFLQTYPQCVGVLNHTNTLP